MSLSKRMRNHAVAMVLCLGISTAFGQTVQSGDQGVDVQRIQPLIALYATSIDQADTAVASQIWSHSPEVSFIDPADHEHGFDEVIEKFYRHTMGDNFSERKLNIESPSIHVYGDTAWSEFYWVFNAKFKANGMPLTTKGRETQIYHKEQGQWRLVHVHYSGMPTTGNAEHWPT